MIIIEYIIIKIILLLFVYIAVIYDIKTYKIPNRLNLAGCISGIVLNTTFAGFKGICSSIIWIIIPIFIMFILYVFGAIGAGDIKLFSVIGSFVFQEVLRVMIIAFLLAAAYGVVAVGKKIITKLRKIETLYVFEKIHFSLPIALGVTTILI